MTDDTSAQIDLDALMAEDPTKLSDQNIDSIIAYHRQVRANRETGGKGSRSKAGSAPAPKAIQALLAKKPVGKVNRRGM
jgi:hypothetical protein